MTGKIVLRHVIQSDLPIFFAQQLDPSAHRMAAFTSRDPTDESAFMVHWAKILSDASVSVKTVLFEGQVAGHVACYTDEEFGKPEVTYWIGKEYWGKGIATGALSEFLKQSKVRPIYGRAAKDNLASIRILEKCGFKFIGKDKAYSNVRGEEVEELILKLE